MMNWKECRREESRHIAVMKRTKRPSVRIGSVQTDIRTEHRTSGRKCPKSAQ